MADEEKKDTRGPTRKILEDVINSPRYTTDEQYRRDSADYKRALAVREEIQDEVAYARVLARRGWVPREEWIFEHDDPRMEAWQGVARARAESAAQRALDLLADGVPSRLFEVGGALKEAAAAVSLLAEHTIEPGVLAPSPSMTSPVVVVPPVSVPIPTDADRLAAAERQPF